jgi:hypothetical protein
MAAVANLGVNNLQLYKTKWHAGLTAQAHLSSMYLTQPELISTIVSRIWGNAGLFPMMYLTDGMGRKKEVGNREYEWMLQGDDEKAIAIIGNFGDGGATPGINGTTFRVKVAEKWFAAQEVVVFDDRDYRARIMSDPQFDGSGYILELRSTNPDETSFIDPSLLEAGRELSKEYTTVSELSIGGQTHFSAPFKMRNHLTTLRKSYTVSRSAATDVMIIRLKDPKSEKDTDMWLRYAEWEALAQWYKELERSMWYSTYSANAQGVTNMLGNNQLPVFEGAGIREQIAPANRREYTELTEDIIREFLIDLSYNIVPEASREFVCFTGEFGFAEFDRAMKNAAAQYTLVDSKFVTGSGQQLTLGGQFKTYEGLNGTRITLKHLPLYDDTVSNRQLHYKTNRPIESYRFTILDFGVHGGESNIQKVYKKDSENVMWHTAGSIDPFGNTAKSISTMRSNNEDGFSVHMLSECGIMIKNPMACGELICTAVKG